MGQGGCLVRGGAVSAAAEQGVQPQALRWPPKGSHLLRSQRSHAVSATGFSIMELLGGRVGVTHTPSGAAQGSERSGSALGNGGTIPGPRHRQRNPAVSRWGWAGAEGPGALTARGHATSWGQGGAGAELGASPSGRRDDTAFEAWPGSHEAKGTPKVVPGGCLKPRIVSCGGKEATSLPPAGVSEVLRALPGMSRHQLSSGCDGEPARSLPGRHITF